MLRAPGSWELGAGSRHAGGIHHRCESTHLIGIDDLDHLAIVNLIPRYRIDCVEDFVKSADSCVVLSIFTSDIFERHIRARIEELLSDLQVSLAGCSMEGRSTIRVLCVYIDATLDSLKIRSNEGYHVMEASGADCAV